MSRSFSISFFPNVRKKTDSQLKPIYCRIIYDRKKAELTTNKMVDPKKWDARIQGVRGDTELNSYLLNFRKEIDDIHSELVKEGKSMSAKFIKAKYLGEDEESNRPKGLIGFIEEDIEQRKKLPDEFSPATIQIYETSFLFFKEFLASHKWKDLRLVDFGYRHVEAFELFLRTVKGHHPNTATKYMKKINVIMNRAVKLGVIEKNPFELYTFKSKKTHRTYLTLDEINRMRSLDRLSKKLEQIRDVFMFGIFTGLRYKDVRGLAPENLIEDEKGRLWMSKVQEKTGELVKFPILKEAERILQKYPEYWEQHGKLLPIPSNQKLNDYIKELAALAKIDKVVTFHVARHTFPTTIAPLNKIPIELVSKWLGHEKLATTMIYKKVTDDSLSQYAEGLDEKLGSAGPKEKPVEDERLKGMKIQWQRLGKIVQPEEKTYNNYVKWVLTPFLWDLERINYKTIPVQVGGEDSIELKTNGLEIQLDFLEETIPGIPGMLRNIDFANLPNLKANSKTLQKLVKDQVPKTPQKLVDADVLPFMLNLKLTLLKIDFDGAFRR